MRSRRLAVLAALAALLLARAGASANPSIAPKTLQCDGTYQPGSSTHHPNPSLQVVVQDPTGLRVGKAPMGVTNTGTGLSFWRFDTAAANVAISSSCVADVNGYCPAGNCWTFNYSYSDVSGAVPALLGQCIYQSNSCAPGAVNSGPAVGLPAGTVGFTTPSGLASCPNPAPALPPSGPSSVFPASSGYGSPINYAGDGAATFNGSQFIVVTSTVQWLLNGTYTLSAWIKATGGGTQEILSYDESWNGGFSYYWGIALNAGKLEMDESRDSVSPQAVAASGPSLNDGAWHQVHVVRRDGVDRRLYADGQLLAVITPTISTGPIASQVVGSTTQFVAVAPIIGARVVISTQGVQQGAASNYFNGQIDEIRMLGAALSDEDIRLEYLGSNLHRYAGSPASSYTAVSPGGFPGSVTNGDAAAAIMTPGEAISTTTAPNQRWIFEAQSTQSATTVLSTFTVTIDQSAPSAPQGFGGAPNGTTAITWSWSAPVTSCEPAGSAPGYYQIFDAVNGGAALNPPGNISTATFSISETVGSPNKLVSRQLSLTDVWGASPLTPSASAYTLAAVPSGLAATSVSTGSFVATWSANGNPGYTRYELTYSTSPTFAAVVSTVVGLGDNFTGTSIGVAGLLSGPTYYVRVRAFNGQSSDFFGGAPSAGYAALGVVTTPGAPALGGAPLSNSSIQWSWTPTPGATGYTLYDSPSQAVLYGPNGPATSFIESGLAVNTRYDDEVEAVLPPPTPLSSRGHAFAYTLANPPTATAVSAVYSSSATFAWNPNGNPAYTFYQVVVATDPAFAVVTATVTVSAPSATATGLLPGVVYYSKVASINGGQVLTLPYVAIPQTATALNAAITVSSAPPTPYVAPAGLAGSWQFDESAGTTTVDWSGNGNVGNFGCAAAACVSTPTFAAGPPGLGTAASFTGQAGGVVRTVSGAPFNFAGSVTVEAWVYPQTAAQPAGAGIVAVGPQNAEDFALDVSAGAFRFVTSNAGVEFPIALATATIAAGQWTHVVGVYDAARAASTLYLNGRAAATGAAPARVNSGSVLSVGNRQDPGGNYLFPFSGRIDSVRVIAVALTAPQVMADYQGGFVSSVTPPSPNNGIIVALPPNAFDAPAQILISADPVNHPIRITPAALNAGLAVTPPGLTLVPNSLVEVVPVVGGLPFTTPLGSSATLTIPYNDPGGTGLISGTNPPLAAAGLRMYTLNTAVNVWTLLPTSVDRTNRAASGVTPHFSVFALFAPATVGTSLAGVKAYPVPWKPGSGGRFDAPGVTFSNLPASGTIRILTLAGRRVREFSFNGVSAGSAVWDGANDDGRRAASGVYFARVASGVDASATMLKFAIER